MQDATGYRPPSPGPYRRIVCLVPSLTELLLDLGVSVVGRTRFCIHPAAAVTGIPIVGGTKDFSPAKIRALAPDLIIANLEENVAEPLLELRETIPAWTTQVRDLPEALSTIRSLGQLTDRAREAEALAARIEAGFAELARPDQAGRTLYLIWREPWMSIGGDTFIHDLLSRCGLTNVTGNRSRYPSLSDAELQALDPELILLASEPYPFKAKHLSELQRICPRARLALVDGSCFSWYGSRLVQALGYFQSNLNLEV